MEDVRAIPGRWAKGDVVLVAGDPRLALDGSEFQARFLGGPAGRPQRPALEAEAALLRFLADAAPLLTSAHDASDGGLAVALAELALWSGAGADVELEADALEWFGEGGGRAVVTCRRADVERLGDTVPLREIGVVGGERVLGATLAELRAAYEDGER